MRDMPKKDSEKDTAEVRDVSEAILKCIGNSKGDVAVLACLNVALILVQGGANLNRLTGIEVLIETLFKIKDAEEAESSD